LSELTENGTELLTNKELKDKDGKARKERRIKKLKKEKRISQKKKKKNPEKAESPLSCTTDKDCQGKE